MNSQQQPQQTNSIPVQQQPAVTPQPVAANPTPTTVGTTLAEPQKVQASEGVNLIPSLTKEQKSTIQKKNTLNIGSILTIIIFVAITIAIVGFNIISKTQLASKQSSLRKIEKSINDKSETISLNNIILTRIRLYQKVEEDSFSHKRIIEYFRELGRKVQGINFSTIEISENLGFELTGNAPDLEQLSRLWYLFGVNENIKSIKLESFNKSDEDAKFTFSGVLILDNFKNN